MNDPVNKPKHYNWHPSGVECISITEHMNFNVGNAIKYLWRTDHKGGLQDLKKARWYIDREIKRLSIAATCEKCNQEFLLDKAVASTEIIICDSCKRD